MAHDALKFALSTGVTGASDTEEASSFPQGSFRQRAPMQQDSLGIDWGEVHDCRFAETSECCLKALIKARVNQPPARPVFCYAALELLSSMHGTPCANRTGFKLEGLQRVMLTFLTFSASVTPQLSSWAIVACKIAFSSKISASACAGSSNLQ